jgi:hypothetical protein
MIDVWLNTPLKQGVDGAGGQGAQIMRWLRVLLVPFFSIAMLKVAAHSFAQSVSSPITAISIVFQRAVIDCGPEN